MDLSDNDIRRFSSLFSGYQKAYGTYLIRNTGGDGKALGKAQTLRGEPTDTIYRAHLEGAGAGLGIIMLREDDTVYFGAIDYDVKTMDHVKAEAKIRLLDLPLVLCRSKSGGGHFYCFVKEPIPAATMRDRLSEWVALLGMADTTEIFPKQVSRCNESDIGNWINIPYYDAEKTNRFAIHNGEVQNFCQFLEVAESKRQTLATLAIVPEPEGSLFEEGPPCLQTLESQGGFVLGTKKEGMFNVAVYLRKKFPDDWQKRLDGYNTAMAQLQSDEVQGIIKQVGKKAYSYKCKQAPINSVCNRRLCRARMYGVGATDDIESRGYAIGALTRYESSNGDEPLFAMEVNGRRVLVTTPQLYSRDEFNRACISQANVIAVHMTPQRWLTFLNQLLPTADIVPLPEDASPLGQLWQHILMFLTEGVIANEREKLLMGVCYREGNVIWFRSIDLFSYLNSRRIPYKSPQQVYEFLKQRGALKDAWSIKGSFTNVWGLPAPKREEIESVPESVDDDKKEAF